MQLDYSQLQLTVAGGKAGASSRVGQSMRFHSMHSVADVSKGNFSKNSELRIAMLNGSSVFIRPINKSSLALSPALRAEVRDLRQARHPNVVAFIGACVEGTGLPMICGLTCKDHTCA